MVNKRVLVVDDSSSYQRLLSDVINERDGLEVVGVASNGKIALNMMQAVKPDVVTLDILMPEMDGIETLMQLCKKWPSVKTILLSSLTAETSDVAVDALALGAAEYSVKPAASAGMDSFRANLNNDLLPKIEVLCGLERKKPPARALPEVRVERKVAASASIIKKSEPGNDGQGGIKLVAIGVSTGGPEALATMLSQMPGDLGVPIVIVQHMPAAFTAKLAIRLNASSQLTVVEAQEGDKLCAGKVYIAPGDFHMLLELVGEDVTIKLNREEPENSCRPSVDPLFRSIPPIYNNQCLGVVMTGMGADGLSGCEALYAADCPIIVQDQYSSVVWGMPKLVAVAGFAQQQVPLQQMATVVTSLVQGSSRLANKSAANADNYKQTINSGGGS